MPQKPIWEQINEPSNSRKILIAIALIIAAIIALWIIVKYFEISAHAATHVIPYAGGLI